MRRLYLQIYLTLIASLVLFTLLTWGVLAWIRPAAEEQIFLDRIGEILAAVLPGPDRPDAELAAALQRLTAGLPAHVTVRAADGRLLGAVGPALPPPAAPERASHQPHREGGPTLALKLPDGRWLLLAPTHEPHRGLIGVLLLVLAGMVSLAAYPMVRRLTRRLEALQASVDELGAGDLSARVTISGHDEVADVARSFNRAAERIEALVGAQRRLLASVSHELRSPLARVRMATELIPGDGRPDLRERIARDIDELDGLIGELLLASRLESDAAHEPSEAVDLLALVAEEVARLPEREVRVEGEAVFVYASPRLLRRLVRNLLDNTRRHAAGAPVEIRVERSPGGARLQVLDRGPGVPESEQEKIFEPFYRVPGARESEGGVGLGLSLVRQIARDHGGDAHCRARQGGGSCFEVTLARVVVSV